MIVNDYDLCNNLYLNLVNFYPFNPSYFSENENSDSTFLFLANACEQPEQMPAKKKF